MTGRKEIRICISSQEKNRNSRINKTQGHEQMGGVWTSIPATDKREISFASQSPTTEMALWMGFAIFSILNESKVAALFFTSKCSETMADGKLFADCRDRGLVNMFDLHLDPATRILDFANNECVRLRKNEFKVKLIFTIPGSTMYLIYLHFNNKLE